MHTEGPGINKKLFIVEFFSFCTSIFAAIININILIDITKHSTKYMSSIYMKLNIVTYEIMIIIISCHIFLLFLYFSIILFIYITQIHEVSNANINVINTNHSIGQL